ncbi:NEW3 domain-containing protein, partial [bacterium]|nr:NEW3 domain-containing protein [bacterium]
LKTFLIYLLLAMTGPLYAQTGVPFNQRDDQYRLLGLRRAKEAYEYAQAEFRRQQDLFDRNLISELDLSRARNNFADAEVNYQQSLLAVLFEAQYVSVQGAVKYQREDGRKHVRLKLANASGGTAEFRKLLNIDDELFRSLQPDIINDVYVSLLNDENAIISQPYEAKIEELRFGQPVELDFTLLQELDAVTVNLVYGSGTQRMPKIYLQKDATVNKVVVQSEQFSQEVELGGEASFDLTLELFSGVTNTFKLEVVNLPTPINRYFVDPGSEARLSQFKFTESTNTRRAALQIYLPDRPTQGIVIDEPIPFYVLVVPRDQAYQLGNIRDRTWTSEEIEQLNVGFVKLDLVPRGVGRLLVRAPQLFHSIKPNETVSVGIELVNEGTRRLDNIEIEADPPLNWIKQIEPSLVPALDISKERRVDLSFTPPADVAVGRYEVRVRTTSLSDNQPIAGEDKTITIEVQPEANVLGTAIIVLLILGLVVGIVLFGVRLSRR